MNGSEDIMDTNNKLSIIVLSFNNADQINELLENIDFADEIIIVDSFSTDGTVEAIKRHKDVILKQHRFKNFSAQRNFAITQSNNDWVLFIDTDERISNELRKEIIQAVKKPNGIVTFGFYRRFFINATSLKYSGFQSEKIYRLFHKKYAVYDVNKFVHETLLINGRSKMFKNRLNHYSYTSEELYKEKLTHYAKLRAEELFIKKLKPNYYHFFVKPPFRFFKHFVIKLGFLDGNNGLKIASLNAFGVKQRYIELEKLYGS
jgi:glycosyltransferase involved in cell wall biosynthesis